MMTKNGEFDSEESLNAVLALCTLNELSFLAKALRGKEATAFVKSQSEGAVVGQLSRKGLIHRFGKVGLKIRWQVNQAFGNMPASRQFLKELLA